MSDERFELQLRMFEKGADEVVKQITRFDEVLFKIKASVTTIWVALIGWGLTSKNNLIIPLGFVVIIGFWLLEGLFRGLQLGYIQKSVELTSFLNDKAALDACFASGEFPHRVVYPLGFRQKEIRRLLIYVQGLLSPFVLTLYLFLALVNLLIWLAMGTQAS